MALYDVHIGWLGKDGALDWGGDSAIDNIPYRQGPLYTGWELYNLIKEKIEKEII